MPLPLLALPSPRPPYQCETSHPEAHRLAPRKLICFHGSHSIESFDGILRTAQRLLTVIHHMMTTNVACHIASKAQQS